MGEVLRAQCISTTHNDSLALIRQERGPQAPDDSKASMRLGWHPGETSRSIESPEERRQEKDGCTGVIQCERPGVLSTHSAAWGGWMNKR